MRTIPGTASSTVMMKNRNPQANAESALTPSLPRKLTKNASRTPGPFTVNGLGVREAFFVSFLGKLGVNADSAFACGFLFFIMTVLLAVPGIALILKENVFVRRAPVPDGGA
jgi:hypothetical protein